MVSAFTTLNYPLLPRPVLQGFGQVVCFDVIVASQVSDGAGEIADAVGVTVYGVIAEYADRLGIESPALLP